MAFFLLLAVSLCVCSPVSFLNPHGLYPTRLLCPWDLPGKNIEVHCHFLLHSSTVITTFPDYFLFAGSLPEKHLSGGSDSKASACNAGGPGSSPRSGRSPGEGNGNPLQHSCLENPMDGGAWEATVHGVTKSRTRLSAFTFTPEKQSPRCLNWPTHSNFKVSVEM